MKVLVQKSIFVALGLLSFTATASRSQQAVPLSVFNPPTFKRVDQNGVDLISGGFTSPFVASISVGGAASGMAREGTGSRGSSQDLVSADYSDTRFLQVQLTYGHPDGKEENDKEFLFQVSGEGWSLTRKGIKEEGQLEFNPYMSHEGMLTAVGNNLKYISKNGDVVIFQSDNCGRAYCAGGGTRKLGPLSWTKPDGEVITYFGVGRFFSPGGAITSSAGWMLKYDAPPSGGGATRITAVNTVVEENYCAPTTSNTDSCNFSTQWPSVTYLDGTVKDGLSNMSVSHKNGAASATCDSFNGKITSEQFSSSTFNTPSGINITVQIDYWNRVRSVTKGGRTWTYEYQDDTYYQNSNMVIYTACSSNRPTFPNGNTRIVTVTDPLGKKKKVTSNPENGYMYSVTDELNRTTTFSNGDRFPSTVVYPEQNKTGYEYNLRGDITKITNVPKPGSDLQPTSVSAGYDTVCISWAKCSKPNWTKDALGNQTDYTYDNATGFLLTVSKPADSNGVRPTIAYSYQQITTYSRNSFGSLSQTGSVWKPTAVAMCQKTAGSVVINELTSTLTCAGGPADLMLTSTSYTGSLNALPTSVTQTDGAGSLSATTTYIYDSVGNVTIIDGPRTDVDDRSYKTYDIMRRPLFEIGPDSDGTGPNKRAIVHHRYDADGNEYRTEKGTGDAIDGSDFNWMSYSENTYDPNTGILVKTITAGR